jgi:hypothetical protein
LGQWDEHKGENQKLKVTVNLRDALWRIRDPIEVRLLRADAVCINQHDNEERGFRVRQMPLIYANAARVLVWLDLLNSKFDDFEDLFNFDFETSATSPADKAGRASRILQEHVARLESSAVEGEDLYPDTSIIANAFSQLFDSPWFTRLWVVQGVGMAKAVLTLVGDATIDFVDLIRFILRLERRTLLMDQLGLCIAGKSNAFTTFPARSRELRGEVDDDWDFLELLEVTRAQQASDPRDYIFALLSHPCAMIDGVPIVEPDYSKSAQELYFEVSIKIMRQTRSLRLLSAIHHGDDTGLGSETMSWIPTWSRDLYVLSLGVYRERYYDVLYDASAGIPAVFETILPQKALRLEGFVFDVVDEFVRTDDRKLRDGTAVQIGVDELISAGLRFQSLTTFPQSDNLAALGQTLTAGFRNQKPEQFAADFAAFRLHLIREAPPERESIINELAPEGIAKLEEEAKGGNVDEIYCAASRFCMGRKLFSTRQGMLGLGPSILREGGLCCVLIGAPVPFVLRSFGEKYKLVGEAYVRGVMKGEAMVDWPSGGKHKRGVFVLL